MSVLLPLLLCAAPPSALEAARAAAAEGRLGEPGGALEAIGSGTAAEAVAYREAVAGLLRQEATLREIYAVGRAGAAAPLLKELQESKALKPYPELAAHAFRLERWVSEAEQLRKEADAALAALEYEQATELYLKLKGHPLVMQARGPSLNQELDGLIARAGVGWWPRIRAQSGRALAALWDWAPLQTSLIVLALAAAAVAFARGVRWMGVRRARQSDLTEVRFLDATDTGTGGASDNLAARFKAILMEVAHRPGRLAGGVDGQLGEALCWVTAQPLPELQAMAEHLTGNITVGPLSVPTKALGALVASVANTPRYRLEGVVARSKDATRITLSRRVVAEDRVEKSWMAEATGTDAAALNDAFRELAYHLAFERLKEKPAADVRAFVHYRQALGLHDHALPADRRLTTLEAMRSRLAAAIKLDPGLAEAKLAQVTILRQLRQRETAMALLAEIDTSRSGELAAEVTVHRALLDVQSGREALVQRAFHALEEIAARQDRLGVNARACRLDAGAELIRLWRSGGEEERENEQEVIKVTEPLERFFLDAVRPPAATPLEDWTTARGYALYAAGRLHLERGAQKKGLPLLERSVVVAPDFAPARVALARAYRNAGLDRWPECAERELSQALVLDPSSPEVHEELGRLRLEQSPPRKEEAAEWFRKAADRRASARFEWGKLLCDPLGKPEEGLQRIREAMDMAGEAAPPYYAAALHRCALQAAGRLREAARQQARTQGTAVPAADPAAALIRQAREAEEWLSKLDPSNAKASKLLRVCAERRQGLPPWTAA